MVYSKEDIQQIIEGYDEECRFLCGNEVYSFAELHAQAGAIQEELEIRADQGEIIYPRHYIADMVIV